MAVRSNNTDVIASFAMKADEIMRNNMISTLTRLADVLLDYAQTRHTFKNQTFNLEDSYGYAIYYNGSIVKKTLSDQKASKPKIHDFDSWNGRNAANAFLDRYPAATESGYTLVVVAGMFYAEWVEKIHRLDVLTGSFNLAQTEIEKLFKQIPEMNYNI